MYTLFNRKVSTNVVWDPSGDSVNTGVSRSGEKTQIGDDAQKKRDEEMRRYAIKGCSDLADLAKQKTDGAPVVSSQELYDRAIILAKMRDIINNPRKIGYIEEKRGGEDLIKILRNIETSFLKVPDITQYLNQEIVTSFLGWDDNGSANLVYHNHDTVTIKEFLARFMGDSSLLARFIVSEKRIDDKTQIQLQRWRSSYLLAFEAKHPGAQYKNAFIRIHTLLREGNFHDAETLAREELGKVGGDKIKLSMIADQKTYLDALRALRTEGSRIKIFETLADEVQTNADTWKTQESKETENKAKKEAFLQYLNSNINSEEGKYKGEAHEFYNTILQALPEGDPRRKQYETHEMRTAIINNYANYKAFLDIADTYFSSNGYEGLGDIFDMYQSIRGLSFWRMSDANWETTKDVMINGAAFLATLPVGGILAGISTVGRAGVILGTARASASAISGVRASIGVRALTSGARGVGRGIVAAEKGLSVLQASALGRLMPAGGRVANFLGNPIVRGMIESTVAAGKFTLVRRGLDSDAEISDITASLEEWFGTTALFGAFNGMEGTLRMLGSWTNISSRISSHVPALTSFIRPTGDLALSVGDATVITLMALAEKGILEPSIGDKGGLDFISTVMQSLVSRVGITMIRESFPHLVQRFPSLQNGNLGALHDIGSGGVNELKVSYGTLFRNLMADKKRLEEELRAMQNPSSTAAVQLQQRIATLTGQIRSTQHIHDILKNPSNSGVGSISEVEAMLQAQKITHASDPVKVQEIEDAIRFLNSQESQVLWMNFRPPVVSPGRGGGGAPDSNGSTSSNPSNIPLGVIIQQAQDFSQEYRGNKAASIPPSYKTPPMLQYIPPPPSGGGSEQASGSTMLDKLRGLESGVSRSANFATLDYSRKSPEDTRVILREKRRPTISERWKKGEIQKTQGQKWADVLTRLQEFKNKLSMYIIPEDLQFIQKLEAVIKDSSIKNVQSLQYWMGMDAVDKEDAQDGILGWRTNKKILEFIQKLSDALDKN